MQQTVDGKGNVYVFSDRIQAFTDAAGEVITTPDDTGDTIVQYRRRAPDGELDGDIYHEALASMVEQELAVRAGVLDRPLGAESPVDSEIRERLHDQAHGRAAEIEATVESITKWWTVTAEQDAKTTAPKAAEYGAADLAIMGKAMESLFPNLDAMPAEERERVGLEMAVAFYTLGKVARLFGAYQQGRLPGEDSWFDLTVYPMMARRIREVGYWV